MAPDLTHLAIPASLCADWTVNAEEWEGDNVFFCFFFLNEILMNTSAA